MRLTGTVGLPEVPAGFTAFRFHGFNREMAFKRRSSSLSLYLHLINEMFYHLELNMI